jgi:hypothetical protein
MFDESVYALRVERIQTLQPHPVPDKILSPRGPFPSELFDEADIVVTPSKENFLPGSTVQNEFKPPRYLRCALCQTKVLKTEKDGHKCGE